MAGTYKPSIPPNSLPPEVREYLMRELYAIEAAFEDIADTRYLTAYPTRPIDGRDYNFDGTVINPGSGKGKYRYAASTDSYVFLG